MYKLKEIYEEADKCAQATKEARDWFCSAWDVEDHVLPRQITEFFGDPALAREWMFAAQGEHGECPALWVVRGERQRVIDSLEKAVNGFVG